MRSSLAPTCPAFRTPAVQLSAAYRRLKGQGLLQVVDLLQGWQKLLLGLASLHALRLPSRLPSPKLAQQCSVAWKHREDAKLRQQTILVVSSLSLQLEDPPYSQFTSSLCQSCAQVPAYYCSPPAPASEQGCMQSSAITPTSTGPLSTEWSRSPPRPAQSCSEPVSVRLVPTPRPELLEGS